MQETYPSTPPVWFSESEDPKVSAALSSLSESPSDEDGGSGESQQNNGDSASNLDNHLLYQVERLDTEGF